MCLQCPIRPLDKCCDLTWDVILAPAQDVCVFFVWRLLCQMSTNIHFKGLVWNFGKSILHIAVKKCDLAPDNTWHFPKCPTFSEHFVFVSSSMWIFHFWPQFFSMCCRGNVCFHIHYGQSRTSDPSVWSSPKQQKKKGLGGAWPQVMEENEWSGSNWTVETPSASVCLPSSWPLTFDLAGVDKHF